ncbi:MULTISPECIES: magnesium transporter CorA family protein [Cetobacterium]|jgi:magnesium transporter|uniref:Magnesium transporter CorA family protein n=1 Tax=Candidatus Cetobacterium colombiensis TaxID=3073100 RepID=A0ABU4W821_9FUSO|nr:magnesium transporter CorA family protein [Candidatus Cetobacterium colombiensis]MDX8335389.1 magnesium transporter CorA family protein [Candidatus Cetobacterium colombiensis]
MIKIYKSHNDILEKKLFSISETLEVEKLTEKNTWIHLLNPTEEEIKVVTNSFDIPEEHIRSALDEEEKARLEIDDDTILVIIDVPIHDENNRCSFTTVPLGIILLKDHILTVSTVKLSLIEEFIQGRIKSFFTFKKTRFILQMLFRNSTYFLLYLKQIGRISDNIERQLKNNLRNQELMLLLELEKSLVYFTTSLKSNEAVLERMMRTEIVKRYPDDLELLEDVIIETKQAIEMANIYSSILSSTRDAFSTVMSNNLNIVMKKLTSITIVFAIPTVVSGLWGMNVGGVPFASDTYGFLWVLLVAIICGVIITWILFKKELF